MIEWASEWWKQFARTHSFLEVIEAKNKCPEAHDEVCEYMQRNYRPRIAEYKVRKNISFSQPKSIPSLKDISNPFSNATSAQK